MTMNIATCLSWLYRATRTREHGLVDGRAAAENELATRTQWPIEGTWHSPQAQWLRININSAPGMPEPYQRGFRLGRNEVVDELVLEAVGREAQPRRAWLRAADRSWQRLASPNAPVEPCTRYRAKTAHFLGAAQ